MPRHVPSDYREVGLAGAGFIDEFAVKHHHQAIRQFEQFVEVLAHQQHRGAAIAGGDDLAVDVGDGGKIEAEDRIRGDQDVHLAAKLARSAGTGGLLVPHVAEAVADARRRAGVDPLLADLDGVEVHDCFTTTEYLAIDHLGLTPPGQAWQAIEDGRTERTGAIPINPSGGLIGGGHPVGATGVRMVRDAALQVTDAAGDCQVPGARTFATLNLGGSAASAVSFIVAAR